MKKMRLTYRKYVEITLGSGKKANRSGLIVLKKNGHKLYGNSSL